MAETTADVRRDIELTRNRISDTLEQLEHKLNVTQLVRDTTGANVVECCDRSSAEGGPMRCCSHASIESRITTTIRICCGSGTSTSCAGT